MGNDQTVLVTGATGQQGGAVARSLIAKGVKVLAMTRNKSKGSDLQKLGAEVVEADLSNRDSLDSVLNGVKKVFLVCTPFESGMDAEVNQGTNMVDAAIAAGVEHLVYSSVASADKNTKIPHFETKWKIEQHINKTKIPATIIRPVFFMENFYSPWFLPMIKQGKLMFPLPKDRKLQMVSLSDIGEFGAETFLKKQDYLGQKVDLAGDEMDMTEAVSLLSKSISKTVTFEQLPDEQAVKAMGKDFTMMFKWFDEVGYSVDIAGLEQKWGITMKKFSDVINQDSYKNRFLA